MHGARRNFKLHAKLTAAIVATFMLFVVGLLANDDFDYEVMARTGQDGLTGIKSAPSINKHGHVAFVANLPGESLFFSQGKQARNITPSFAGTTFSTFLQLADDGTIVARDGSGTSVRIRIWDANQPDTNLVIAASGSGPARICFGGPNAAKACSSEFDCQEVTPFGEVIRHPCVRLNRDFLSVIFPAMNNLRQTVFQGVIPGFTSPTNILVSSGVWGTSSNKLDQRSDNIRPVIADNGYVVGRAGSLALRLYFIMEGQTLQFVREIAGSGNGFTEVGQTPGISDDGGVVGFYGNLADAAIAASLHTTTGPGIFAFFTDRNGSNLVRVARLRTSDPLDVTPATGFTADNRVTANKDGKVAFLGVNVGSQKAIFIGCSKARPDAKCEVEEVVAVGDTITNLVGTVQDLTLTDGLNDDGNVAFLAAMSDGSKAIVKASEKPCKTCKCKVGQCELTVNSIDLKIGLGNAVDSSRTAYLKVSAASPAANLSTPAALALSSSSGLLRVFTNGALRQVRSGTALADISVENDYRYSIRFYVTFTGPDVDGVYTPAGMPFSTVTIDNPDGPAAFNRLRVVQNGVELGTYNYVAASAMWELVTGFANASRKECVIQSATNNLRTVTRLTKDGNDKLLSSSVSTYQTFAWGEELVETRDGSGPGTKVTTYAYYSASTNSPNYAHLRSVTYPNGRWEFYREYDPVRGLSKSVSQFQNNPYSESPDWPDSDNRSRDVLYYGPIEIRTEYLRGHSISRRWHVDYQPGESWDVVATDPNTVAYDSPSNLMTRTFTYTTSNTNGAKAGATSRVINPDGTASIYGYFNEMAQDPANPGGPSIEVNRTVTWSGQPNSNVTEIIDGTASEEATDIAGNLLSRHEWDIASGALTSSETVTARDEFGRATRTDYLDGTYIMRTYGCCGLASETDREGITTTYDTDNTVSLDLDHTGTPQTYYGSSVTRAGITTHTLTDPLGRAFKTILQGTNGDLIVQDERAYNVYGDLDWSRDAMGRQSTYSETTENGFTLRTTTFPDGSQSIQSAYQDGSAYESRGSAVQGLRYAYNVVQDNGIYVQVSTQTRLENDGTPSPEYTTTYTDFAGRSYKTEYPWPDGGGSVFTISQYNSKGQLAKVTDPDGVTTLYQYNGRGELETAAIDMANPDSIDFAGTDRITRTRSFVNNASSRGVPVRTFMSEVWEIDNADQPTVLQTTETSLDGTTTWTTQYRLTARTVAVIDRASQRRTVTATNPDNTSSVTIFEQGRQSSITRYDRNSVQLRRTTFAYDAFGRLRAETDARNGATTYTYYDDGQLHAVTTPGPDLAASGPGLDPQTTTYAYYHDPVNGIKTVTTLPDAGVVTQEFFPSGQLKKTWGARTYPAEYSYDRAGRVETLKTWQQFDFATGNGLARDAVTTWNYNERGLLANKRYADNKGPTYTYTAGAKLSTRLWARGILTTYHYDPKSGDLAAITYSDDTPAVTNAYDRRGRLHGVIDASGSRALDYANGQVADETYRTSLFAGVQLHRGFDSQNRLYSLSVSNQTGSIYQVNYGYDPASRLQNVTSGPDVATYAYHPDSDLVHILVQTHSNQVRLTTTKLYDRLNRLQSITSVPSADSTISFAYQYNEANQRTRATLANGEYWTYGYDPLGQVTNGVKRFSNGIPIPGYNFGYQFDHIGNRLLASREGRVDYYTNNLLNQIESINYAPYLHVLGQVNSNATITVNGQTPTRTTPYFYAQLPATSLWNTVSIQARAAGQATNGTDALAEESGRLYRHLGTVSVAHDEEGNLSSDERWVYNWDGENRLKSLRPQTNVQRYGCETSAFMFTYDSHGRRIAEMVLLFDSTNSKGITSLGASFLYDGWNSVMALHDAHEVMDTFTWGLDMKGSFQSAGGVGGLLFKDSKPPQRQTVILVYDGNGNVIASELMDTGNIFAEFEYDVFGQDVRADVSTLLENRFGFATKYLDGEFGSANYGLRNYKNSQGRWLSRDPAGERYGGQNLYRFVNNNSVNSYDILGLWGANNHYVLLNDWLERASRDEGKDYLPDYRWHCLKVRVFDHLKKGNDDVDGTHSRYFFLGDPDFYEAQSSANSYQHAMRGPGQSTGEAMQQYAGFISSMISDAYQCAAQARLEYDHGLISRSVETLEHAIYLIGRAQHPVADSTSPPHEGFQLWLGPIDGPSYFTANSFLFRTSGGSLDPTFGFVPELIGIANYGEFFAIHHARENDSVFVSRRQSASLTLQYNFQHVLNAILRE